MTKYLDTLSYVELMVLLNTSKSISTHKAVLHEMQLRLVHSNVVL